MEGRGKVPFNPVTDSFAKSSNPNTFHNWKTIITHLPNYLSQNKDGVYIGGLGLGIFNGFSIDIDDCIDKNGVISDMALDIIEYLKFIY